jgi:protein Tex
VRHRDEQGAFASRAALKKVPRLGAKTFEQSAGFLRIATGTQALDRSAVHPEAYPIVERILADLRRPLAEVMGEARLLREVDANRYTDEQFGLPTVRDILRELEKPGRDPRPEFKTATFQEGVEDLKDLRPGMLLEGVITNVTNFGAFVDIGVHQDGLVHVSMLSHRFIKDPRELVKAGDVVKVKVLEIDLQRRRIALTMKLDAAPAARPQSDRGRGDGPPVSRPRDDRRRTEQPRAGDGVMAEALARALRKGK